MLYELRVEWIYIWLLERCDHPPKGTEYYCIKISLSAVPLEKVLDFIRKIIHSDIILHDIDITQDVPYITIRKDVMEHILRNGIIKRDIVDDRRKVGDNCISFLYSRSFYEN